MIFSKNPSYTPCFCLLFFKVATYTYLFVYDSFDLINLSYLLFFVSKFSCTDILSKEVYYKEAK